MKILIIDDEMMIKEWLKMTISSLSYDITVIDTASNGEEALRCLEQELYDLIFIDVMMPRMNGLEFLKTIYSHDIDAMLVVLSSHDEFKFAKEAIRYNVKDYVLKNECSKEKLEELLGECRQRIDDKGESESKNEELLERALHGNMTAKSMREIAKSFSKIGGRQLFVAVLGNDHLNLIQNYEVDTMRIRLEGLIGSTENHAFYLFSISGGHPESSYNKVKQDFAGLLSEQLKMKVSLSRTCKSPDDILPECRNGWIGYQQLFYSDQLFCSGPTRYRELDTTVVDALCDKTLSTIRSYAKEKTVENLKEINEYFARERPTDVESLITEYLAILSTFIIYNNKSSRNLTEKLEAFRSAIYRFERFSELSDWIIDTVESNAELIQRNSFSESVERALGFIEEHYRDIKSVNEIADQVNLSIDYFSRHFKKEVGVPLNSYLINYRLDKASVILLSSNLSVQEVAKKVGIDNGSYFSKCFKKKFHTQPIRFRIQTKE